MRPENEHDMVLGNTSAEGGETAAFRELFDRYYAPLCRFAACWFHDRTLPRRLYWTPFTPSGSMQMNLYLDFRPLARRA